MIKAFVISLVLVQVELTACLCELQVPLDNINFDRRTRRIVLGIGIVLSWAKDMGVGTLACQGGCVCESKDFSTYLAYAGWSMTFWEFVSAQVRT